MHLTLFSAAIIALTLPFAGVRAQLPPQVTPCIENCLVEAAAQDLDGCSVSDVQCLCANKKIQQDALSCLQQQCTTQELEEVQVFIAAECAPAASSSSASSSSTHSTGPSTSVTHSASSSEPHTSEKTSISSTTTIPSTHLSSTTSVSATSLANSTTSLVSTSFTAPLALSSSSPPSSSSATSNTTASAAPARTNAAVRAGQDSIGIGIAALGAVFGGAMVWR
ncbi:hypothetical protein GSI_11174 [Ganoderma sinense ZZ0214-1]|uniref:CFEM domain-containing protein n=1 Tax=Ganoderma sinense ZZ0214-1 TaxID=1077348 RepID=A0A2G8RZ08_9APHY|nr:hypothetical protein GSI_11174 [Ganoderma sinense ZZ0214-1]